MLLLLLLVTSVSASPGGAQDSLPRLEMGTRVRLELYAQQHNQFAGNVVLSTPDSVGIRRGTDFRYAARMELDRLEVSNGRDHGRGAVTGAIWGAILVAAPVAMRRLRDDSGPEGMDFSGSILIGGAATGAIVGALIGGMVGSERWLTRWERQPNP